MFGPRITTVFRSRWRAVWWVLSVLVGVYWSIPSPNNGNDDEDVAKDAQQVAALLNGTPAAQPASHVNPWARSGR